MRNRCPNHEATVAHVMMHTVPAWGLLNAAPDQRHHPRDLSRLHNGFQHIIECITAAQAEHRFADELKLFYSCLDRIAALLPVAA